MQALVRLVQPTHESAFIQKFLDLVACGTVADVMPLLGENRVFASFGLRQLAVTRKVGLRALLDGAGIKTDKPLSAEAVGFGIGPRINAVGRLDDAAVALDLMLTGDPEEARMLVEKLNAFNVERQQAQRRILEEAKLIVASLDLDRTKVLVIASPGYHGGISGLVKNALDYLEELREDPRPYLDGRPVGLITTGAGWQATMTTMQSLRSVVHALRGWPTPLGVAVNSTEATFAPGGPCSVPAVHAQLRAVGEQVMQWAGHAPRVEAER